MYAENTDPLGEDTEHRMMMEATKRLMENYRSNSYEYYPFGYVKRKKLSEKAQRKTGMQKISRFPAAAPLS